MDNIPSPNNCLGGVPQGVNDVHKGVNVVLYPNPTVDELRLLTDDNVSFDRVLMYNSEGKEVLSRTWNGSEALNVGGLEKGFYFVRIFKGEELYYSTTVIKK